MNVIWNVQQLISHAYELESSWELNKASDSSENCIKAKTCAEDIREN